MTKKEKSLSLTTIFLENRLKTLEPDVVDPGCKGTKEKPELLPWEWVKPCMDDELSPIPNRLNCPICGKKSEELLWIDFSSPKWTWEELSGEAGALSICTDCHCQVEFICVYMN